MKTDSRMLALAQLDIAAKKLTFLRWTVWTLIVITCAMALVNGRLNQVWFGIFFIILPLGVMIDLFRAFVRAQVGQQEELANKNPAGRFSFRAACLINRASSRSNRLWYYLLREQSVVFCLTRLNVAPFEFYSKITQLPDFVSWLEHAQKMAKTENSPLEPRHIFEVVQGNAGLAAVWDSLGVSGIERADVWRWWQRYEGQLKARDRGFSLKLTSSAGIGRDWASGYATTLRQYSADITDSVRLVANQISLVGHAEERRQIINYLARDERHNIVLVGEDGIGKKRLLYTLAADFIGGNIPDELRFKHIVELDTGAVINGASDEQIEQRLTTILNEAESAGNMIVVVPDFKLLVGAATSKTLGILNASGVLTGYLQRDGLQMIALATPSDYATYIRPNQSLAAYLQPIEVHEIGPQEALIVLEDEVFRMESKRQQLVTFQALTRVIAIAQRHVHDRPYPEKALKLLEDVVSQAPPKKIISASDVDAILTEVIRVPLGQPSESQRDELMNLEQTIRSRIVGQSEAVKAVANALRRMRSGLTSGKRPVGTFLFLGPTGVGKTEMARTIAEVYYRDPKALIRLDMSEYQTPQSVEKLIGTPTSPGALTTAVTDKPFSVVLLDEIEKADAGVRHLFLQVLDAGRLTDGYGKTVDFTNTMVIATSNAGANAIREAVEANQIDSQFKTRLLDHIQDQGIFTPEWINRFDATVVFLPLTPSEIKQVARLMLNDTIKQLATHDIELTFSDDVLDFLVEKGYDPEFGARPMRRAIQDSVENVLAKLLLNNPNPGKKTFQLSRSLLES